MYNLTVLIVDDDDDCRRVLRLILEQRGVRVVEAYGGEEAPEIARLVCPQLIFMDLLMPDVDGREAARRIRELQCGCAETVIIAYSALATFNMLAEFMEGGFFTRYIDKVFLYDEMDEILRPYTRPSIAP